MRRRKRMEDGSLGPYESVFEGELSPDEKIALLESEKTELLLATIDLADLIAVQNVQLQEQSEALIEIANTLAEVTNNG